MSILVLFEGPHIYKQTFLNPILLHQIFDRNEAEIDFGSIVETFQLPPAACKEFILGQSFDFFDMLLNIEAKITDYERSWTRLVHLEAFLDHLRQINETCNVVDQGEDAVQIHIDQLAFKLTQNGYCKKEKNLDFLGEKVCPEVHDLRYW